MGLNKRQLEWVKYLAGGIEKKELSPENRAKLEKQRQVRKDLIDRGIVPVKPFDGGIVS